MIVIYKITSPTDKIYVGQTLNYEKRLKYYNSLNCKNQVRLYKSFLKYGLINHKFEIIEECLFENLNIRERYWQDYYDAIGKNGLNCVLTKTNTLPYVRSEETKIKISESCKGRIISEEHKEKLRLYFKGKKRDENIGLKISKKLKGRKLSEEHIKKLKDSHLGYKYTEERKLNASINSVNSKKVFCIKTKTTWNSITDCARYFNTSNRTLKRKIESKHIDFLTLIFL